MLSSLGLSPAQAYLARDLWAHTTTTVDGSLPAVTIPAHGSVMFRVSSAAALINDQITAVSATGGGSFADQLRSAQAALSGGDTNTACGDLDAYVKHVKAQSGKQFSTSQAAGLVADAQQIKALIGC